VGGRDFYCDGRSVPPALTDRTACPGKGLLSCEFLTIPVSATTGLILLSAYITRNNIFPVGSILHDPYAVSLVIAGVYDA
jgi:hypothetical protein